MDFSWESGLEHRLYVLFGSILGCLLYYHIKAKGGFKDKFAEKKFVLLGFAIIASIIIGNCIVFNRWDTNFILTTMSLAVPKEYAHTDFYFHRQSLVLSYVIVIVWSVNTITNFFERKEK